MKCGRKLIVLVKCYETYRFIASTLYKNFAHLTPVYTQSSGIQAPQSLPVLSVPCWARLFAGIQRLVI